MRPMRSCLRICCSTFVCLAIPRSAHADNYALEFDGAGRVVSNRDGANGWEVDIVEDEGSLWVRFSRNGSLCGRGGYDAALGDWAHIATAWSGTAGASVDLYVNGELAKTAWCGGAINPAPGTLHIGAMGSGQVAASVVHSPSADGQLGSSPLTDPNDPSWTVNGAPIPAEALSIGRIKTGFVGD